MKTFNLSVLCLFLLSLLASCGGDSENSPSYEFKDQNLQGMINGESWSFITGTAQTSSQDPNQFFVDMAAMAIQDPCNAFVLEGNRVFFSIPNEVGVHQLHLDLSNGTGQTATLFDQSETLNVIATQGAIELLTITSTEVTGRMDARGDTDSFVNGNFTLTVCN